jgi:hypothetical protein
MIFSFCQGEFFGYPLSIIFREEGEGRKGRGRSSKYSQRKSELRPNPSFPDVTFVTACRRKKPTGHGRCRLS